MEEPKWKTTVIGILAAVLGVLTFVKPDWFNVDTNPILVGAVDSILVGILIIISLFSAKDEIDPDNIL